MSVETHARNIIITGVRDLSIFRRYVRAKRGTIVRPVKSLWKRQREVVNLKMAEKILQFGGLPQELMDEWEGMIIDFVNDDLASEWGKSIEVAGGRIAGRVNKLQRKQFEFNNVAQTVKDWIDTKGGKLIVDLSAAQYGSAHALIQHQITWGVTSPYLMAQRIKPIVGLTQREALAVVRVMTALQEEGMAAGMVSSQVDKYAKFLHNNRAFRIARTEISNSYNFGQFDSVRQARAEGWLPGDPEKQWMAGGQAPCEICEENEADGPIPLDNQFSSGDDHPTAHPQCECSVGYSIRR